MNNIDYFITACQHEAYRYKEWALSVFCVSLLPDVSHYIKEKHYPGKLYQENGLVCYRSSDFKSDADSDDYTYITLNGKVINYQTADEPIVLVDETIAVSHDDLSSIPKDKGKIETTPGKFFFNCYCYYYAFGNKVEYINDDQPSVNSIAEKLGARLKDNPPEPSLRKPTEIYVDEFKKMLTACNAFSGFASINSPSATKYTMTPSPEVIKRKKELLEKNKDKLDDPVTIINIEKELVDLDKKYIANDPHQGFYIKAKSMKTVRKKLHTMEGLQVRMDPNTPPTLLVNSLSDPVNLKDFPAKVDGLRYGSYARGAMTALGGEAVKFIYRLFGAASIIKEDCGAKRGIKRVFEEYNKGLYLGSYIIENGKNVLLTSENVDKYVGKVIEMRTPGYCVADPDGRGYCSKCFGESMRGHENSLGAYGAAVTSAMNGRFMAAMHDDSMASAQLRLQDAIS